MGKKASAAAPLCKKEHKILIQMPPEGIPKKTF